MTQHFRPAWQVTANDDGSEYVVIEDPENPGTLTLSHRLARVPVTPKPRQRTTCRCTRITRIDCPVHAPSFAALEGSFA